MKKRWRKFKNRMGWDFKKVQIGRFFYRKTVHASCGLHYSETSRMIVDVNGCYAYVCKYCGMYIRFPWRHTVLAYHNMQRHLKAKHIDTL